MQGFLRYALAVSVWLFLGACNGDSDPPVNGIVPDAFRAVDEAALAAFEAQDIDGMGLAIYDRNGVKVFERMYGDFTPDRRVAIASASKLVSGVLLFRLIDQGYLSLDTTTGQVLGWTDDKATITLRHLLSFTSGLTPELLCTYQWRVTLAECVDAIAETPLVAAPGTQFDYGSTHLHIAARMAELATGTAWNELFRKQILEPLGLPVDLVYYANPHEELGTDNPLAAGGLRMSMNEYEPILRLVFNKGQWQGASLFEDPSIFDQQAIEPFPGVLIGKSPRATARYGLTAWLECSTPASGCASISSPGAFGFVPWIDREAGYYAILGMEIPNRIAVGFSVNLQQQLKPLIEQALAQ